MLLLRKASILSLLVGCLSGSIGCRLCTLPSESVVVESADQLISLPVFMSVTENHALGRRQSSVMEICERCNNAFWESEHWKGIHIWLTGAPFLQPQPIHAPIFLLWWHWWWTNLCTHPIPASHLIGHIIHLSKMGQWTATSMQQANEANACCHSIFKACKT